MVQLHPTLQKLPVAFSSRLYTKSRPASNGHPTTPKDRQVLRESPVWVSMFVMTPDFLQPTVIPMLLLLLLLQLSHEFFNLQCAQQLLPAHHYAPGVRSGGERGGRCGGRERWVLVYAVARPLCHSSVSVLAHTPAS